MTTLYDIAVIGGGINGCGIAREAAGRGYAVYLCEQGDLAGATSSASTKLIHGGLRYLEHREFRLVRGSLAEREVLWRMAPHIIRPLRFILPHHRDLRPAWLLRLGLFLYDHLGGRERLAPTRTIDLTRDPIGAVLAPGRFKRGFEYSDCWADDARLVVLNARDAAGNGAVIRTRTRASSAVRERDAWALTVDDLASREKTSVRAKTLVNAAGPWVGSVLDDVLGVRHEKTVRLVQGSHIVVPRLYDDDRCFIFQTGDGRIVFAIPYEDRFTLIGTTDRDYRGDPAAVSAGEDDIAYLCEAASGYFRNRVRPADVVWSYSGVRPLFDDGAADAKSVTRDYVLDCDDTGGAAVVLSVFGGKITTYRRLAEHALQKLAPYVAPARANDSWRSTAPLPGGDFPTTGLAAEIARLRQRCPWLAAPHARRLVMLYGTDAARVIGSAGSLADLGRDFGATLSEAEVAFLMDEEWASTAPDIVWRRTKLGLSMNAAEIADLDRHMQARREARRRVATPS